MRERCVVIVRAVRIGGRENKYTRGEKYTDAQVHMCTHTCTHTLSLSLPHTYTHP